MARSKGPSAPSRAKMPSRASKVASRHTPTNARVRSGAGLTSNKLKRVGVSYGRSSTNKVSPSAADQLGQHLATPKQAQPLYTGVGPQPDSGNMLAATCPAGPGGGRTVYARGTNQVHGPVAQGATGLAAPDIPGTAPSARGLDSRGRRPS
jgi:hypothetical protein